MRSGMILLAVGIGIGMMMPALTAEDADYVSNKQCKICHNKKDEGDIWNKWSSMAHAKAFKTLEGDKAKAIGTEKGLEKPPAESPECLKCHVTGYNPETKEAPAKISMEDGVQCESCHGKASLHVADGKKYKMKKDTSIDMSAHIIHPDETVCRGCHNEGSPTWNPEQYTIEDGQKKVGFDFKQAWEKIKHGFPEKAEEDGKS